MAKKKYYAYLVPGKNIQGVTEEWKECEKRTKGVSGARYQSFGSESEARNWLREGAEYTARPKKPAPKLKSGVYFDAGTGRGDGVEVSVTDEKGKDLLDKIISNKKINKFGKLKLPQGSTNNFGELEGIHLALQYALEKRIKHIFGDSKLIIDYWSLGIAKEKDLPDETVRLIRKTTKLREEFESSGGSVERISGDYNPADLGFH